MSGILNLEPFTRTGLKMLMCLHGFSHSGKTYSAIEIVKGLIEAQGGKACFLDTETGRARMYAERAIGFTYAELTPQFTPERYIAAINQIEEAGYNHLIIDSGSHEWEGLGGMLDIADEKTASGKDKKGLSKWLHKKRHKKFMNCLLASRMNIIICLRSKEKFKQVTRDGREEIISEGFIPIQERGFRFEMIVQLQMMGNGRYIPENVPEDLRYAFPENGVVSKTTGKAISDWLKKGIAIDPALGNLKNEAQLKAEKGTVALRDWFQSLPNDKKVLLKPFLDNYKSIATTADEEEAMASKDTSMELADVSDLDDNPIDLPKDEPPSPLMAG